MNPQNKYGYPMPVRYIVPMRQQPTTSPPFANQAFNRFNVPQQPQPGVTYMQPVRGQLFYQNPGVYAMPQQMPVRPYGYHPGFGQIPSQPVSARMQAPIQQPQQYNNPYQPPQQQQQPPPSQQKTSKSKKNKEYADAAFTIDPTKQEAIKGLLSNNDINDLLKVKGTKVKVAKIYRITKTKPEQSDSDDDDEYEPVVLDSPTQKSRSQQQRPISADSHCSTCSSCSCSECRGEHDNCPECLAEKERMRRSQRKW
ncbi:unnamed protein product [Didymodactylos carnosus]|uniref:Uncharacterized protein n=1 Tax=Didymodactylos carnosus TaxID=1234261 RepID=A0A814RGN2_9BILA|nr:unnamed protein product [Didymodactylos carnosus]CAF1354430.1 unnamed protein product [Didymodactylos carnosus]CAF3897462.1 unnamed protein product [Didymodactylos carnosus]CAF4164829.1 unnamed protein product [Didymodactylos carnosus]